MNRRELFAGLLGLGAASCLPPTKTLAHSTGAALLPKFPPGEYTGKWTKAIRQDDVLVMEFELDEQFRHYARNAEFTYNIRLAR